MKRRKPIDNQGHTPRPGGAQAVEECATCHDVHIKGREWRRPCSRMDSKVTIDDQPGPNDWPDKHEVNNAQPRRSTS